MKYFKNVETLEELRRQYKELLKKYHPDNPQGSTEATQEINAEYDSLFNILKNRHDTAAGNDNSDKKTYSNKKYDFSEDEALRQTLQKIINFSDITIDIVGCFIWLDGNTYPYKEQLKEYGFKWSGQRKKWYWQNGEYRKRGNSKLSYSEIQDLYGSTEIKTEPMRKLQEA